jgi:PTH1 family peptidyl-tRNA hydrolase
LSSENALPPPDLYLIVGLGNPGAAYEGTRHNIGARAVCLWAKRHGLKFRNESAIKGELAAGIVEGKKTLFLFPTTYMNSSGESVRRAVNYFKPLLHHLIVVCDDIALPLGKIRFREKGSAGGHNGLKSVEEHLGTQKYARLRIGVGDRKEGTLADHVLSRFSAEEEKEISPLLEKTITTLEAWLKKDTKEN